MRVVGGSLLGRLVAWFCGWLPVWLSADLIGADGYGLVSWLALRLFGWFVAWSLGWLSLRLVGCLAEH